MKERFAKSAHIFITLAVPLGLLIGTLTGFILKTTNPDNIDITAGLAYLGPAIYAGYGTLILLLLLGLIASIISLKMGQQKYAKTTLITLLVVILCVAGAALAQKQTDQVEDAYSKQQVEGLFKQLQLKQADQQ